jgi:hypothetical protein
MFPSCKRCSSSLRPELAHLTARQLTWWTSTATSRPASDRLSSARCPARIASQGRAAFPEADTDPARPASARPASARPSLRLAGPYSGFAALGPGPGRTNLIGVGSRIRAARPYRHHTRPRRVATQTRDVTGIRGLDALGRSEAAGPARPGLARPGPARPRARCLGPGPAPGRGGGLNKAGQPGRA